MKVAALLCGILASAFAWAAPYLFNDLTPAFLALFPGNSPPLLGLLVWNGLIALALLGGLLAVAAPMSGTLVLLAAAFGWALVGLLLPMGFVKEIMFPGVLAGLGAVFAFAGALLDSWRRRDAARYADDETGEDDETYDGDEEEDAPAADFSARNVRPEAGSSRAVVPAAPLVSLAAEPRPVIDQEPEVDEPPLGRSDDFTPGMPPPAVGPRPGREIIIERRSNPLLVTLNVIALLLLAAAVAVLLYSSYRSGELARTFGLGALDGSDPAPTVALVTEPAPAAPEPLPALEPIVAPPPADSEVRVTTTPLDLTTLATARYDDPFDYCAAVGTVDAPDARYIGPAEITAVSMALPGAEPARWRCLDGAVLACTPADGRPVCNPTPTMAEMSAYCAGHPDTPDILAPAGSWSCRGARPQIPVGQVWPVDERGFLPGVWVQIAPPVVVAAPAG